MGNLTSFHRHSLYWGTVLLLMIPPSSGWNIPFFGGDNSRGPSAITTDEPTGVRIDVPAPLGTDPLPNAVPESGEPANIPLLTTVAAPIIGPVDAPHLRYIPSYFNNQIPDKLKQVLPTIVSKFHTARVKLYALLWYKPPVGIVGAWSFLRILEKMYGLYSPPPPTSGEEALADAEGKLFGAFKSLFPSSKSGSRFAPWGSIGKAYSANVQKQQMQKRRRKRKRKVRKGRSFDLDRGDRSYDNFGGIETVRVRACQEGLRSALAVTSSAIGSSSLDGIADDSTKKSTNLFGRKSNSGASVDVLTDESMVEYANDIETAIGALQLSCPPKGSREYFVEQSAEALSDLNQYISPGKGATPKSNKQAPTIDEQNLLLLLKHSSKLIEMRTLDALLRTLRDRHLIVAARLRRTREYWKWHVNLSGGRIGHLVQEIRQKIMTVLPWMGDDFRDRNQREYEFATATLDRELEWLGRVEKLLLERPEEMEVGDLLSVAGDSNKQMSWWNSLVNYENGNDTDPKPSMSASVKLFLQGKNRKWIKQSEGWTKMARDAIKDSLDETISSSFTPIDESANDEDNNDTGKASILYAESDFLRRWADYEDETADAASWLNVLSLVDYAASPKRAGERRYFQLAGLANRIKRYDFLGIPSSALVLAGANSLHDKVIEPNKQQIIDLFKNSFQAIWGIWEFRFYTPMKDIVLDLLNRRPRMVDPFALLNEQTSLDNMLLDLGVGDGTRQTRAAALAAASRMYEQEVAGGAIRGIIRGRVAQLMLIQIQQLKADLLQAMDTIDSLVDANRLNVQLVASIPAVLILFFGTRALFLFWSNVRMQDFRLPRDVHAEMSDYLKKVEECLVLSNYQLDSPAEEGSGGHIARADVFLKPKDMGQLLLLLHSYLNLLDYMSPPFPNKQCDSIHQSVQNLLMQGQMSTSRQLELLKVIQSKHADLLKSL